MRASLDTDITIHLYSSGRQGLMFSFFEKLYMHQYLYEKELKLKSRAVFDKLSLEVSNGKVEIITNRNLFDKGVAGIFENYKREYEYLFDSGEQYAIALAKAMGLIAFVSDDTKEFGPHETLVKELIEDVIPFAFYELLFLRYLSSGLTIEEMHYEFEEVNSRSMGQHPMNFRSRMLKTVRRFSSKHGTERDYNWVCEYCEKQKADYGLKMRRLKKYLLKL